MKHIFYRCMSVGYEIFNQSRPGIYSGIDEELTNTEVGIYYIILKIGVFLCGAAMTGSFSYLAYYSHKPEAVKVVKDRLIRIGIVSTLLFCVGGIVMLVQKAAL